MNLANGNYELRLGDCLDHVTGLSSLPDKSVSHVITDPPYEAEAHTLQRRTIQFFAGGNADGRRGYTPGTTAEKPLDFEAITSDVRDSIAEHAARVSRRWLLAFCQAEAVGAWRDSFVAAGAKWKRSCIWIKPNGQPQLTGDRPGTGYESIACAHAAGEGRSRWNGGGKHGVYTCAIDTWMTEHNYGTKREHPTQKPTALMEMLVRDFTDSGDLICDPFAGSGTTGVAAIRLGRRFIGWERNERYFKIAQKRIAAAREQLEFPGAA